MANHKSALKRAGQSEQRRLRNRTVKTRVKNAVKTVRETKSEKPDEIITKPMIEAQSVIDKAAKKGVLHKRTAARKISRLARLAAAKKS